MMTFRLPETDKIRSVFSYEVNRKIDREIEENIRKYTYQGSYEINQRIKELEEEWDIERILHLNLAGLALLGIGLSFKNKNWLFFSGTMISFVAFNVIKGWAPPLILLRKLGYRTRKEIDCELYAMKFLRGDFAEFHFTGKRDAETAMKEALIAVGF
jgi:hypothetical protein